MIPIASPDLSGKESLYVNECLESTWISSVGHFITDFEVAFAKVAGTRHVVATNNGTTALHLALVALGIGPGDEVIVPTLTYIASANAVVYCGASPVFIDSDLTTWNMDPELLEQELGDLAARGRLPAAVIAVDVFGQCADYDALSEICARYQVPLVQDAAESLGSTWGGASAGSFGAAAILSFNGNKIMTTSGGGMLLTGVEAVAVRARHLATQAREPVIHYEHRDVGYNYRLSNVLAAMGSAQLERLPGMIERRQAIRAEYGRLLKDCPELTFQPEPAKSKANAWLTVVRLGGRPDDRNQVLRLCAELSIEARPVWKPMHRQPAHQGCRARLTGVADDLFARGVCMPSGSAMTGADVGRVAHAVRAVLEAP